MICRLIGQSIGEGADRASQGLSLNAAKVALSKKVNFLIGQLFVPSTVYPWLCRAPILNPSGRAPRSPSVAASCYIDAVVNNGNESHGWFLVSWKIHPPSCYTCDPACHQSI
jgi:hypothetical protein